MKVNDPVLFETCLNALKDFSRGSGKETKGRFVQIFLGLKYYQNELPSMHSGSFVSTHVLQMLLDDLFSKKSKPLSECVLMLFQKNFLPRTGITAPNRSTPQNTWRNNFNSQKGVGCYAPPSDLSSNSFLDESRVRCKYLIPEETGTLSGGRCSLCQQGTYRGETIESGCVLIQVGMVTQS